MVSRVVLEPHGARNLELLWRTLAEECSQACVDMLKPYLSTLFRVGDMLDQIGNDQLRGFFRCVGQLHERAQRAEVAARHWQDQWDRAFGHAIARRAEADEISWTSQAAVIDMRHVLDAVIDDRDRFGSQVGELREELRSSSLAHITNIQERDRQLRIVEDIAHRRFGTSENECRQMAEFVKQESSMARSLYSEVQKLNDDLASSRLQHSRLYELVSSSESYAVESRMQAHQCVQEALAEQRTECEAALRKRDETVADRIPRSEALAVLSVYAELWRCAASHHTGFLFRRAEAAARELIQTSELLGLDSPLVQEPLQRAIGKGAYESLMATLAESQLQRRSNSDGQLEFENLRLRGLLQEQRREARIGRTGAASLMNFLPSHGARSGWRPILEHENR
eukprot:TRINITY_DN73894_c0_g1_i1.p1 TRINITY_DN73894_c0_g1~~TRINITY_DN73894_c0_g1_i1.p1  ORF type:complete len:419 (-),score=71.69 TRINITY_DN73894_c0_g1_i1:65-1255(-)